jgi:DNA-binding HxlR family transcriptional regulator
MINLVVRELVNDGTITRQQEATTDDPEEKYEATEDLDKICKEFRDSGLSA